ncbi:hypothetical protein PLICBS_008734 [Purpureocillium lilacinum]|uniref:uncharacterized protein n=1 Tax=Purpureocillium lilacinum TaxID=33203 RepID=UPI002085EE45|nr:hypothetical protein PLICBS_008734 [Purpureocillium lilacinum]
MAFRDNRNADDGGADKLRISMTNLILGRDPIVTGNRQGQRKDETAKIHASANGTGGEAEKIVDTSVAASQAEENKDAAAPTGGDAAETASEVASSCSHGASSDECSDCKNKCSECEEAEGNDQEGSASAEDTVSVENSAAAQDENSSVGADADQPSSPASASASANDGDSASEGNTGESPDKVASAYDGSAQPSDKELSVHSSSGAESGGEDQDSSGKGDDASTGISTPGADSSNDGASDQGSHKAASAENTDSNESSGPGPASDSGWSISEDHLLRGMKEAGDVTWAEIGQALNRGKNEVKARWKVIQKAGEKHTADADKPQSSASEPSGENKKPRKLGKADNSQAASSDGNDGDAESVGEATKGSKSKGKGKGKAPAIDHQPKWRRYKGQDQNKSASSKAATSEHEGDGYEDGEYEEDDNEQHVVLSGEEASSESSFRIDGKDDEEDEEEEDDGGYHAAHYAHKTREEIRYLHQEVYRELYPDMVDLQPDEYFGEEDCAVLAAMDSKYKRSRYLEMQANFFNATGRLVPLHLIRDKIERAEEESSRGRSREPRSAANRHDAVEKWVNGVEEAGVPDAGAAGTADEAGPAPKADPADEAAL